MQQVSLHKFIGAIDYDSPTEVIPKGFVPTCRNIEWSGIKGDMRPSNTPGTVLVWNGLPAGNNLCIGRHYDEKNNQEWFANYNSNGTHGIYVFDWASQTVTPLILNGTNTEGDVLGFTPTGLISSWDIMYGDANIGNFLFWVNSQGVPCKINIQRQLGLLPGSPPYNPIKTEFLTVIKAPPRMVPKVCFENDQSAISNNLVNVIPKFRLRYVYDDKEFSVYSGGSIAALPNQPFTIQINSDPTQNCRVRVCFPTGDVNVTKIELWVQTTGGSITDVEGTTTQQTSDWLLIKSFEKSVLGIPSLSIYQYLFYNNTTLTNGDITEIDQPYDCVPRFTNAGKVINGNINFYAGITEGFNKLLNPNLALSTANISSVPANSINGCLFFAAQGDVDTNGIGNQITVYLFGAGNNDGNGNPTTINNVSGTLSFTVDCATSSGSSLKFTTSATSTGLIGDYFSIPAILSALLTAAEAQGFTLVGSVGTNSFTIQAASTVVIYGQRLLNTGATSNNEVALAHGHKCYYDFARVYFDAAGRNIGAQLFPNNGLSTLDDLTGNTVPQITMTIRDRPPIDAVYWAPARSKNLTTLNPLFWICNQTFLNTDLNTGQQFCYLGISNMIDYNQDIEASTPVVKYDFSPGDRVQFLIQYPLTGAGVPLATQYDYPITALVANPTYNGIVQQGNFIQIAYPQSATNNNTNPNFQFGGDNFQRYKIRIYTPVVRASGSNVEEYQDFGLFFGIGNALTANAFHIGLDQTQSADLSTPAILSMTEGDFFWRQRNIPTGLTYYTSILSHSMTSLYATLPTQQDQGVIDNSQYQIGEQNIGAMTDLDPGSYPQYSDSQDQLFWNKLGSAQQIRVVGTVNFTGNVPLTAGAFLLIKSASGAVSTTSLIKDFFVAVDANNNALPTQSYNVSYDVTASIPATSKAWLVFQNVKINQSGVSTLSIGGYSQRTSVVNPIQVPIIEPSFNDQYNIVTNSNLRPFIYDETAGEFFYGTRSRWSQAYQDDTSINNSNRFYATDNDDYPKEHGDVKRLILMAKNLLVAQERKWGTVGVYQKFIKNNQGETELIVSNDVITQNNIEYYAYKFGIGNQSYCIASYGYAVYFIDPITGKILRLSEDGITDLTQDYRVQKWAGNNIPPYLTAEPGSYAGLGTCNILGCFHVHKDLTADYILVAQQGTGVNGDTLAFNEKDNSFRGFKDFNPDMIDCMGNNLISWKNGALYVHNGTAPGQYTTFYGTQYYPSIDLVFNQNNETKKTFNVIQYYGNQFWEAFNVGDIKTSLFNPQTGLQQISQLIAQDFYISEGLYSAALLRDGNSQANQVLAILQGDYLKGIWLSIKLTYRGNNFAYLYNPALLWVPSPRNF